MNLDRTIYDNSFSCKYEVATSIGLKRQRMVYQITAHAGTRVWKACRGRHRVPGVEARQKGNWKVELLGVHNLLAPTIDVCIPPFLP